MGTSPPKQKAPLSVTLNAMMVAAAASAALPPSVRMLRPAATACCPPAETAPFVPLAFQLCAVDLDTNSVNRAASTTTFNRQVCLHIFRISDSAATLLFPVSP